MSGKLINLGVHFHFGTDDPWAATRRRASDLMDRQLPRLLSRNYDDHVFAWHEHRVRHLALHTALSMEQADTACRMVPEADLEHLKDLARAGAELGGALNGFHLWARARDLGHMTGREAPEEDDMPRGTPVGFFDSVEEGPGGWAVWAPGSDGDCGGCKAKASDHEDGEPLMAFSCPVCEGPGCDICMPAGRGCPCPNCEDEDDEAE